MVAVEFSEVSVEYRGIAHHYHCLFAKRFHTQEEIYACGELSVARGRQEKIAGEMVTVLHRRALGPVTSDTLQELNRFCAECPFHNIRRVSYKHSLKAFTS